MKTGRVCHRKIEAEAGRTDGVVWNFHAVLLHGRVGIESMYVQILRRTCESDLLATLIHLDVGLFCKNSPIHSNTGALAVLGEVEAADGGLTDTHGCAKTTTPPPQRLPSGLGLTGGISSGEGA